MKLTVIESFSLQIWLPTNWDWKAWVSRIRASKSNLIIEIDIHIAIDLSTHEFEHDGHLVAAALCFWNSRFNHFKFKCGPIGPTVSDVCHLLGFFLLLGRTPCVYEDGRGKIPSFDRIPGVHQIHWGIYAT